MKRFLSLKTLVWLAGIAFGFMIVSSFINGFEDFKMGFYRGAGSPIGNNRLTDTVKPNNAVGDDYKFQIAPDVYFLKLAPKKSIFNFPDSIENIKTKSKTSTRYYRMKAALPASTLLPSRVRMYSGISVFLSLLITVAYIFLIINLFLLLSSLQSEAVFEMDNIKQLRMIGIALVLIFILMSVANYLYFLANKILFEFEHYNILYDKADTIHLFLGVVILIVAEIINRGLKLKQENELTI
ncbi:MAG: DUF2975 domain-containing protein [Prolixibacteraceae bacterium]|jgi:hypothetical protein|nr:DUF2975 domain-containing protein [Prolixibacteraceae bacterium]